MTPQNLSTFNEQLFEDVVTLIENARFKSAVFLNVESTLLYWKIGNLIQMELKNKGQRIYGKQILATLSQQLTSKIGKGFSYTALTRMMKVANTFDDLLLCFSKFVTSQ